MDLTDLRVLLVEDNELDQRMMLRYLSDYPDTNFIVRCVGDLASAMAAVGEEGFDCILLDLSLPDSAGLASVDALVDRASKSPVVVLTGLDDPKVAVEAVERGAQDFLTKQRIDAELAGRSIRYAIARHQSETQLRSTRELLNVMHDRERIARDLHDTVIQQLFATGMALQALTSRVEDAGVQRKLIDAASEIDTGIRQLREAIFGLHANRPEATVTEELMQVASAKEEALGFRPTVRVASGVDRVGPTVRHELIATASEALSNVAKHANATATQIIIEASDEHVVLRVVDNGRGIDRMTAGLSVDHLSGRGLRNMERRATELSGEFAIGTGPGGGTELVWRARVDGS